MGYYSSTFTEVRTPLVKPPSQFGAKNKDDVPDQRSKHLMHSTAIGFFEDKKSPDRRILHQPTVCIRPGDNSH